MMANPNPSPETRFGDDNKANQVHGGEAAVKAIQRGETFKGLAASEERNVKAELQAAGRAEMVRQEAVRLKTACNLYWGAVCKAADDGNIDALDRYIKRYGWLAGATLRAWAQVKEEDKTRADDALDYAELVKQLERQAKG
jgi:hypothetical protein